MTLNETDFKLFKKWLRSHLRFGAVTITFTKKDGTDRVMECTTNPKLVPQILHETNTDNPVDFPAPKKERKVNEDIMPVYDLESKAWKSFRWDSIKSVMITIGEEREHHNEAQ